ncbi:hypothetical protein EJO69_09000 [Flaviflexus salsibiostraticola]|uniref:SRPBCC family protein n=1 Tax=Flaviflexus salsibiostraticola TaxID=1282737 RepID=A0A3S8ZAD1_9ACTO|nr:hypothetical protein [Flaviflexus salsibiostraticola]AZN30425.1 hypothetical protein EJO69_09000 [Flaviflexus salsibiostraticola]
MRLTYRQWTRLSPAEALARITAMRDHAVPFTVIDQDGSSVTAITRIGPIRIEDNMEIRPIETSGTSARGSIVKTGPVLAGTLSFAAVETPHGTVIGWDQDLHFLPLRLLDPVLAIVMRVGYGIAFSRLLRP